MVTFMEPRNASQMASRAMGYTGEFGAGGDIAFKAGLTPEQLAQHSQLMNTPAAPALAEPLHQYERAALTGLSNTGGLDNGSMSGAISALQKMLEGNPNFLNQAGQLVTQGTSAITPQQVEEIRNPYAGALKSSLSKSAERLRAQLSGDEGMRGARSFGDTATGVRQGMVDEAVIQGEQDIDYKTFADALAQITGQKQRELSGAGIAGGLGSTAANIGGNIFNMGSQLKQSRISDLMTQLGAGEYIRGYNQDINNKLENDILASQSDPINKILTELKALGAVPASVTPGKQSTVSTLGNAGAALFEMLGGFSGGGSGGMNNVNSNPAAALPWLS